MATQYDTVNLTAVESTQDASSEQFARTGRPTLVIAARQSSGRGRQGRSWEQADRAMFASYTYGTDWPEPTRSLIPLVCGLAMREALADHAQVEILLKWPNDLILGGKKVGGILVETSGARVTSGCGVNLWWRAPLEGAAALYADDPGPAAAQELAVAWVRRLDEHFDRGPDDWRRDDYLSASATVGKSIAWASGEGIATGLDPDGALVVATDTGQVSIHAGDVHTRR